MNQLELMFSKEFIHCLYYMLLIDYCFWSTCDFDICDNISSSRLAE